MNPVALVQSQLANTLLTAFSAESGLVPGGTVEARLLSLDGNGLATALVNGATLSLLLAGPEAKQAALQPGAILLLRIAAGARDDASPRATLLEVRPPAEATTPGAAKIAPQTPQALLAPAANLSPRPESAGPATILSQPPAQPQPAEAPVSPRALAGPLLGQALARQDSLAPLFANLAVLAEGSVSLALPRQLLALVNPILAQAVPVERSPLTGPVLKEAVARSGLFLEANEAQATPAAPAGDLKAGLRALRELLLPLIGPEQARPAPRAEAPVPLAAADEPASRPAPPRRDGVLTPQPVAAPSLSAAERPLVIVETLLDQTEAALDRMKLAQFASLPLEGPRSEAAQQQRWLTEIPLAFQAGIAMLPLQIEREPPRRDAAGAEAPLWRIRFALDVEPLGPLQGVVTLQGRSVGVSLWAEREETSGILRQAVPGLQDSLADAAFESNGIDIRTGQPRVLQPTAGQFLDRLS